MMILWALTMHAGAASARVLEWSFDDRAEVSSAANFAGGAACEGRYGGPVRWDPYIYLALPPGGLDATEWEALSARIYSSAPADVLDVYYQSPDGRWGLGASFPIARGWATYTVSLADLAWHESSPAEGSRQWGGTEKRVSVFRLDPGNEADRWVMLDWVKLHSTLEGLTPGVVTERMGLGELRRLEAPAKVTAGEALSVSAQFEVRDPPENPSGTAYVRVGGTGVPADRAEFPVDLNRGNVQVTARFPISRYAPTTDLAVEAGVYELDMPGAALATVHVANPRSGRVKPPLVTVERLAGDPTLHIDGKPTAAFLFVSHDLADVARHAEMAKAGVHLYCDWFGTSGYSDLGHIAPDVYDYTEFDTYFARMLETDPEARFLPHIGVTPPLWWQKANPDELCLYADGERGPQSFASEKWRADVGEDLRRLIDHLQKAPYADRIIGYIPYSGYSAEWQSWGLWQDHLADYSAPALKAFRAWLQARYREDAALRTAWGDDQVTFATAQMPDAKLRHSAAHGVFRDPVAERPTIDFYEFLSHLTADAIRTVCRVTKEASGRRSLVGTYYGYLTQHQIRQQDSSHCALEEVLQSPDVDFLMSPPMYTGRELGGTSTFMSYVDAVRLRGKLWLSEADYRTSLTPEGSDYGRADTLDASRAILLREFGEVLVKREAVSWYDMSGGWLSDRAILADLGTMRQVMQDSLATRKPFHGDVGVFIDERSFFYLQPHDLNRALSCQTIVDMPRIGVAWDAHLLTDFLRDDLPDYRLYLCLNAFYVPNALREAIHRKAARNGATVLWVYAPGYCTDQALSTDAMTTLTGVAVEVEERATPGTLRPTAHTLCPKELDPTEASGVVVSPSFRVADRAAEVIALRASDEAPAVAQKRLDGWTSVYSASYNLPPNLLRSLARAAGCHIYLDTGDPLYADNGFVCVHARKAGEKAVRLRGPCRITNAMTREVLVAREDRVSFNLGFGETVLLATEPR
jgi:Beta-galactosidase